MPRTVEAGIWVRRALLTYTGLVLAFIYIPPTYLFLISFNPGLLPQLPSLTSLSFKWYAQLFAQDRMLAALSASMLVGVLTALIAGGLGLLAALAYLRMARRSLWFNLLIFPMFVPGVIQGLSLSIIFKLIRFKPSIWTIVAGHVLWALPFAFLVTLTALAALRRNLLEAAQDLGATEWQTFRDVILPIARPGITGALLFSFLLSFNEYIRAFFLVGAQDTLPIYMFGLMNAGTSPTIYALAGSILMISFAGIAGAMLLWRMQQVKDHPADR